MLEGILITVGVLYIVWLFIRGYYIYYKTQPHTRQERQSAPYYYKTPKQGTTRAQDCGKLAPKTSETKRNT